MYEIAVISGVLPLSSNMLHLSVRFEHLCTLQRYWCDKTIFLVSTHYTLKLTSSSWNLNSSTKLPISMYLLTKKFVYSFFNKTSFLLQSEGEFVPESNSVQVCFLLAFILSYNLTLKPPKSRVRCFIVHLWKSAFYSDSTCSYQRFLFSQDRSMFDPFNQVNQVRQDGFLYAGLNYIL